VWYYDTDSVIITFFIRWICFIIRSLTAIYNHGIDGHVVFLYSLTAIDNHEVEASPLDILIILCTGCSGNGHCNYNITSNSENELFKRATCECDVGYTGISATSRRCIDS
jgi:hypothetical protein